MYEEFFGFTKKPFSIVPDSEIYYLSAGHREAMAHLIYGIKNEGGFVLLTGDIGTGKTTACRRLLDLLPEDCDVAIIYNPKVTVEELLATICDEFGISYPKGEMSIKVFVDRINNYLLEVRAKGRRAVLILEEAQNLKPEVLEQIRLLTNLETSEQKLLQMIMIGQPELRELLRQPQLRQLSQRITARYHLGPLSKEEVPLYVNYRLSAAGAARGQLFPPAILKKLFRLSGGVPRLINVICDRALLGAFVQEKDRVDRKTLITAAREVTGEESPPGRSRRIKQNLLAGLLFVFLAALGSAYYFNRSSLSSKLTSLWTAQPLASKTEKNPVKKAPLSRPGDLSGEKTLKPAQQALFRVWGIEVKPGAARSVCEQAQAQGLRCLSGKGSVISLRQMNKPVVLTLNDGGKDPYYGTLTAFKGETAVFSIGNEVRTVDLKEISQYWSGDYLLLWRVPIEYKKELKPGSRGPLVAWLERHLALAQGRPLPDRGGRVYNQELEKQVKKFQLASGMTPDGIVGPKTIMPLSAQTGNGDPVLHDRKGGN
ncbi:MAG: AAA family ATPase [Pseudomonadota bacterium]